MTLWNRIRVQLLWWLFSPSFILIYRQTDSHVEDEDTEGHFGTDVWTIMTRLQPLEDDVLLPAIKHALNTAGEHNT